MDLQGATFDPDDYTGFTAMLPLIISDPTLRDGSHAVKHQLTREHLHLYSRMAEKAGLAVLEVGHIK